jgi:DNA-binding CsgD family transcriptional regulator
MLSETTITAGSEAGEAPREGFSTLIPRPDIDRLAVWRALIEARQALDAAKAATRHALTFTRRLDQAPAGIGQTEGRDEPGSGGQALPASRPVRSGLERSCRERGALAVVTAGYTNKTIAWALGIAPSTVKTYMTALLAKLGAANRVELAAIATRQNLHRRAPNDVRRDAVPLARGHMHRCAREIHVSAQITHLDHPSGRSHYGRWPTEWLEGAVGGATSRPAVSRNGRHTHGSARDRNRDDAVPMAAKQDVRDEAA